MTGRDGRRSERDRGPRTKGPVLPILLGLALVLAGCGLPGVASDAEPVVFPEGWAFPEDPETPAGSRGMVATADSLATTAGLRVLRDGGNAVDAAVATHFALAVVYPRAGNLGGGGFLVFRGADGTEAALDFREEAPGAATPDMYLDEQGDVTDESWTGHLASGVPGSVAGMETAHERFGSLPWRRLLEPAIRLASEGFRVDSGLHDDIADEADRLRRFPPSADKWLPDGAPPAVGSAFRQPHLARVLRAVADSGASVFYRGWIADSLAAEMGRGGGIIERSDLAAYEAKWREPIAVDYRGRRVISMPPPSSGGVTLAEILQIVEGYDLAGMGFGSADAVHVVVEAFRRAYADRNYYLGDPDFVEMPIDRLTGERYADSLRATIRMDRASPSEAFDKVPAAAAAESPQTTHYSVVDSAGNAVAVTTTLNGLFGSGVTVRGGGFVLNNEMDDFTAKPGVPNAYGLVQGEANAIRPGKRMLSSMSPTIVAGADGRTELVTGTPGGATIITTVYQIVSGVIDFGMDVGTAVDAPRVHHQHLPDRVRYEMGGLRAEVVRELRRRGHEVEERDGYSGNVQSIRIRDDGLRVGRADPRGSGSTALGY